MTIDNNILAISNVIFKDRDNWKWVTEEQKEQFAFIFNRFFSKKFPQHALCLNLKEQDKSVTFVQTLLLKSSKRSYR